MATFCPVCQVELLDTVAAAELAGVSPRTLSRYLATGDFPDPDLRIGNSPAWVRGTVLAWVAKRSSSS